MVILLTLIFCSLGYLMYASKHEVSLMDEPLKDQVKNEADSFKELEDILN